MGAAGDLNERFGSPRANEANVEQLRFASRWPTKPS
jgi:hypothetical protein